MARSKLTGIWSNFGINVGTDINQGAIPTDSSITADALYLKSVGITNVRCGGGGYIYTGGGTNALVTRMRNNAKIYHDLGFNVQYVLSYGSGFNATHEEAYNAYVAQEAAWAQSEGIERFQPANELEINTDGSMTEAEVGTYVNTLPAIIDTAGFTGEKTYSMSQSHFASFPTVNDFDDLGLDVYGSSATDLAGFIAQIDAFIARFGAKSYLSEWSGGSSSSFDLNLTDPEVARQQVIARFNAVKSKFSVPCYFFTWKFWSSTETQIDYWSACTYVGDLRKFWYDLISQRNPLVA